MKIIGHNLIAYKQLVWCENWKEIWANASEDVVFKFNDDLIKKCIENKIVFSISTDKISEILLANASGANIIIVQKNISKKVAKIAQNYLFDAQIAVIIQSEKELEKLCKYGVDVAIFKQGVINANI